MTPTQILALPDGEYLASFENNGKLFEAKTHLSFDYIEKELGLKRQDGSSLRLTSLDDGDDETINLFLQNCSESTLVFTVNMLGMVLSYELPSEKFNLTLIEEYEEELC
jgi:hypothetical protein